ncbi:hypothetical protein GCM10010121_054740 [Streptomyces brasiliensis]|uniref:Uncharacterized protein n=1 Tax=Streptomyces brasiliensis TaxID=1954 RepID=A0A917KZ48_9ACTN|nr:hypothetical protein GCM10010121_054740 [Streptomyces brasiliensis]
MLGAQSFAEAEAACFADNGYQGASLAVRVPYRGQWANLSAGQQAVYLTANP